MTAANNPPTGLELELKEKNSCSSCHFVKRKWHKTFTTIKNRI